MWRSASLKALADDQLLPAKRVAEAIANYDIDPEGPEPGAQLNRVRLTPKIRVDSLRRRRRRRVAKIEVKVPDIGDFKDVPIIEVLVKPGEEVKVEQSLVTLESDKATMDVPSPIAGKVARDRGQGRRQGVDGRR